MPRKTKSVVSSSIAGNDVAASSISINTSQPSPIYRLPLEVRMIIYGFVFRHRIVDVHQHNGPCIFPNRNWFVVRSKTRPKTRKGVQALETFRTKPSPLAIAGTCRQFYEEAVKVWYPNIRFFFYGMQCMMRFMDDIGIQNWLAIRHVGLSGRFGPDDEVSREISYAMQTFPNLKSITYENVGNLRNIDSGIYFDADKEDMEMLMGWWKEEAEDWLQHRKGLESVFIQSKSLNFAVDGGFVRSKWMLESREIKLNKCTGEIVTSISRVERKNTEGTARRIDVCTRGAYSSVQRLTPA